MKKKLLLMSSDDRDSWSLDGRRPTPMIEPGATIEITAKFAGPMAFVALQIGPARHVQVMSPTGMRSLDETAVGGAWLVDLIEIDGVSCEVGVELLEATARDLGTRNVRVEMRSEPFGVGSLVRLRATNIGDAPAHFYASWALEDLQ